MKKYLITSGILLAIVAAACCTLPCCQGICC